MAEGPQFPAANDPLGELLHHLRLEGSLYCRSELAGDWSLSMPVLPGKMMFHIITAGHCWLTVDEQAPVALNKGTLVLVPHGSGHLVSSRTDIEPVPLLDCDIQRVSDRYEVLRIEGDGEKTSLTCGIMGFDQLAGQQLIQQLPAVVMLEKPDQTTNQWLTSTLDFIAEEASRLHPGGETIITHLGDILVIQLIRHWMNHSPDASEGWLGAIRDRHIGAALRAIHQQPQEKWTVDSLARIAGMSRSGFSAHFKQRLGNSVKNYLTEWRMKLACQRLQQASEPLIVLANDYGYESEAAFSRAFKRVIGYPPGQIKHHSGTTTQA